MIEVTDLYDAFHALADQIWRRFHYRRLQAAAPELGLPFGDLMDHLEVDLFFGACARLIHQRTGRELDPDDMRDRLRLTDAAGLPLPNGAASYHFHGFDAGEPYEEAIENLVIASDLKPYERPRVRIFADVREP